MLKKPLCGFLFLYFFSFVFTSCDSDPVTPPPPSEYEFDSARFNWSVDTLGGWGYDFFSIYSPDTNNVFAVSNVEQKMVHIHNNIQTSYYFTDFYPEYINGFNENDFYVAGAILTSGNNYKPHLKKWNGGGFIDINVNIPNDTNDFIRAGIINSPSDMWFATVFKLIKYDGINFTSYKFTDTARVVSGFYLNNGIPRVIANYYNSGIDSIYRNFIYDLQGDTVIKIYQNIWYSGYVSDVFMYEMNTTIYGYGVSGIYNFSFPYLYLEVPSPNEYSVTSAKATGNSLNDFLITMYHYSGNFIQNEHIYHWNGIKFSKENVVIPDVTGGRKSMQRMNEDYFIVALEDFPFGVDTYLFKGTRKK